MKKVTVYTTSYCAYCERAKRLLREENIPFKEVDVEGDDEKRNWLTSVTGQRTVPQIFFGETPIGGFAELYSLKRAGKLFEQLNNES